MVSYLLFIALKNILSFFFILMDLEDILQYFKLVNWLIVVLLFWCHKQIIKVWAGSAQLSTKEIKKDLEQLFKSKKLHTENFSA